MPSPLVTVVIPIYNQAKFVVETVSSVLMQTHRNLQVVVVDDGSTDHSADLLSAEFGDRIVLMRQQNAGPSAAINAGLAAADGEFIALLGGDDLCVPERIGVQLDTMRSTSNDIIFCKPLLIDEEGLALADEAFPVFFNPAPESSMLRELLLRGNFLCASSAFLRRDAVEQVGRFHPGLIQLQDYDYWLRAAAAGLQLAEVGPRIVSYRRHSANLSAQTGSLASVAETLPIIKSVLETGLPWELRKAFPYLFKPVANPSAPLTAFDKALLLLAHPRDELRMLGMEIAISLCEEPLFVEEASRFGLHLNRFLQKSL